MAERQLSFGSFKQHFDDQLTCSVCLDQYTDPKTLPCLHSFCLECIQPLPVEIKDGKYYISCPTCRVDHLVPQGGATNFPNAFQINSLLDLRERLTISKPTQQTPSSSTACPKHNDPLKVYCETCCQVICCECTISKEHNTHNFQLISECYPKHHQQIQKSLNLIKHRLADINTVATHLATREREVLQQGQQLKEQINTHAQQIMGQVQKSQTLLSQQVDTIVQQKTQVLTAQRQQAQRLHTQLETCQEMIEHSLKEWTKQQILTEKRTMMDQMNTATQHVDTKALQPWENANIQFIKTDVVKEIGLVTTTQPSAIKQQPIPATIHQSHNVTTLLSQSTLSSTGDVHSVKSDITQTSNNVAKTNVMLAMQHPLMQPKTGIASSSAHVPAAIRSPETRDKPVNIITGLNKPCGIAVCENGDVMVVEKGAHCITVLNSKGKKVKSFGTIGTNNGQFMNCHGIAISMDGHILVTDHHRLQKLTTDGVCVKSVGKSEFRTSGLFQGTGLLQGSGSGQLEFYYPQGIAVHPTTGQIFVADSGNDRIQVFTNDLTFSRTICIQRYHFRKPCDVALDNKGYLYVAEMETYSSRITKLTETDQYVARFGFVAGSSSDHDPGKLLRPSSLTVCNNLVYVTERGNHRVSIFDTTGKFLHCFKREFNEPSGIAIDSTSGNLYVSDRLNSRLVVF